MGKFNVNCPYCGGVLEAKDDWGGIKTHCAFCRQPFIIPIRPEAERTREVVSGGGGGDGGGSKNAGKLVKLVLKILSVVCLLAVGTWIVVKIMTPTPESLKGNQLYVMTQKRLNRGKAAGMMDIAKHDFFPIVGMRDKFFYCTSDFKNIFLKEDDYEMYSGTVQFRRGQKIVTRPVTVDRRGSFTNYRFPFKYAEHPEYLEEDGDLIFRLAVDLNKTLDGWNYVSGKADKDKMLVCTIEKEGKRKTIRLKAEQVVCKDNIGRIWVELLPE